jgi:murein DD-endopeptidase MepM/ murein hydrolase activator NlpD
MRSGDRRERFEQARPRRAQARAARMAGRSSSNRTPNVAPIFAAATAVIALVVGLALMNGPLAPQPAGAQVPRLTVASSSDGLGAVSTVAPSLTVAPAGTQPVVPIASSESPGTTGALTGYRWPLTHGRITTPFGPVAGGSFIIGGLAVHDGLDIASFCGDPIHAAHDATVIATGRHVDPFLGWLGDVAAYDARLTAKNLWSSRAVIVVTDDGNGYRSLYVHLARSSVKVGQRIAAGDVIGYEGRTGYATGCHLHYSIFSPSDPRMFPSDPTLVKRLQLPAAEVARLDPLTVFPAMSTVKVTWGWGVQAAPLPSILPLAPASP